jgi:hypothetical protein
MNHRSTRLLLPLALAAVGVWLLAGCVYIPVFGPTVEGKNASKSVGSNASRKPIRAGRATHADVVRVLGEPQAKTADDRVLAYTWVIRNGYAVWPLCFGGYPVNGSRTLVLRFDERHLLRSFEVLKMNDPVIQFSGSGRHFLMPPEIEQEQRAAHLRAYGARLSTTRPTTSPAPAPFFQPR